MRSAKKMRRMRTLILVHGFTAAETGEGIPHLLAEFADRHLLASDARWDDERGILLFTVESEDFGARLPGGTAGAHLDLVWDCVMACVQFSGEGIRFEVEASEAVQRRTQCCRRPAT